MIEDFLAECFTLERVARGCLKGGLRHADRLRRDHDPFGFQPGQRDLEPLAGLAKHLVDRDLKVFEGDLAGVVAAMA